MNSVQKHLLPIFSYCFVVAIPVLMLISVKAGSESLEYSSVLFVFSLYVLPIFFSVVSAGPMQGAIVSVFACLLGMFSLFFTVSDINLFKERWTLPFSFLFLTLHFILLFFLAQKYVEGKNLEVQKMQEDVENLETTVAESFRKKNELENICNGFSQRLERYSELEFFTDQLASDLKVKEIKEKTEAALRRFFSGGREVSVHCFLFEIPDQPANDDPVAHWILRHRIPLLVTDTSCDGRFPELRPTLASLLACPLESEKKIIGLLRLETSSPCFWKEEDLRLLADISNVVSLSLTNAIYFEKIESLAVKDSLTGLFVRYRFDERIEEEFARAKAGASSLSLLILDIDFFKKVNDCWGHAAGDMVLKELAILIMASTRETDFCARYGGEEFAVIMPFTDIQNAFKIAERIRKQVAEKKIPIDNGFGEKSLCGESVQVTVSGGLASLCSEFKDPKDLIGSADRALYLAKDSGRNRIVKV